MTEKEKDRLLVMLYNEEWQCEKNRECFGRGEGSQYPQAETRRNTMRDVLDEFRELMTYQQSDYIQRLADAAGDLARSDARHYKSRRAGDITSAIRKMIAK